jgi:hypothetical protein
MTVIEFAIAQHVRELLEQRKVRELTRGEEKFLARMVRHSE